MLYTFTSHDKKKLQIIQEITWTKWGLFITCFIHLHKLYFLCIFPFNMIKYEGQNKVKIDKHVFYRIKRCWICKQFS